jgi:hypothetical protein
LRVPAAPRIGPQMRLKRGMALLGAAAAGLVVVACGGASSPVAGSSSGTGKASGPGAAASSAPSSSARAGGGSSTAAGGAGSLPVCRTSQLKIAIGPTGAVAGMSGGDLTFTNTGSADCQLTGWPQLVGVTASGTSNAAVEVHSTQFGPFGGGTVSAVKIAARAAAAVAFIVGANNCPDSYRTLRVTPPGNTQSVEISAWLPQVNTYLPACAPINVSPLVIASQLPNPAPQA